MNILRICAILFDIYRQNLTVDASSRSVNGSGFLGNTLYNVTIAVNVKYPGLQSSLSQVLTPEGSKYIFYGTTPPCTCEHIYILCLYLKNGMPLFSTETPNAKITVVDSPPGGKVVLFLTQCM